MATASLGHEEVHAIENALEVSPSQHQPTSPIYHGSHDNQQAKAAQNHKASADKEAEKDFGEPRVPAVHKSPAKNKPIAKAT